MKPYRLNVYDERRQWVGGWDGLTTPLPEVLKLVVAEIPAAKLYVRNKGKMQEIPRV